MKQFVIIFIVFILFSCKREDKFVPRDISKVEIEYLLQDSLLNVRAIEVNKNGNVSFATSKGEIVATWKKEETLKPDLAFHLKHNDTIIPNFRALAITKESGYAISIASPALLYKIDINNKALKLVYHEENPKAFYDAMAFWNEEEGIAIGDPTDGCMSIIVTRDGGETWEKLSCNDLPKAKEGEAAFAASDTNIEIVGDKTWVATGGKASRVLFSPDRGQTWDVFNTPIIQGIETTGMYSIDFYDALNGFAIGGDYTKPDDNVANKIRTTDGGKTWELVAENQNPGYRSCVQYFPNRQGKELIAIGFKGIDYSNDSGDTWKHLSDEGFYTIRFVNDSIAYAAGAGRVSKLIFRE